MLSRYATADEGKVATKLIEALLARGYVVSVNDGEETTVRRSSDQQTILDALCTTGIDTVVAFAGAEGPRVGAFCLIYGNAEDGSELISDYTDNAFCNAIADKLAA